MDDSLKELYAAFGVMSLVFGNLKSRNIMAQNECLK